MAAFRAACALVVKDNRVLGVTRPPSERGRWGLPGGDIEGRETAAEAAQRELYEETGAVTLLPNFIKLYEKDSLGPRGPTHVTIFLVLAYIGKLRSSREGRTAWVPWKTITTDTPFREIMRDVQSIYLQLEQRLADDNLRPYPGICEKYLKEIVP